MRFPQPVSLKELANLIHAEIVGDENMMVVGLNEIHRIEKGELVFVDHPKYYDKALNSNATFVLINKNVEAPEGKALLISQKPFDDFNKIIRHYANLELNLESLGTNCRIAPSARIHKTVSIGDNVVIGENVVIHPHVSIYSNVQIGDNTVIHANTVLGSHAFYYKKKESGYDNLVTCGRLIIEQDVEIGANCTIDKGVTADTIIGAGTKIDNLVQIGHDTVLGKKCLFASQVGVAGCVTIEDNVTLWGQVGLASGITIKKNAVLYAQSGTNKTLEGDKVYFGSPAEDARKKMKELAMIKRIPELLDFIRNHKE
ncbi:MAG TPA: UDP-3-O-(3-hydroxymyristoyl)glucosamine N-acyltransferase [Flavobacteriales bacterium]|nr:UDP-3-O-(3-hydroxymyristoyl)glucosamine N-acyltransferase [Flavobacteriales bacterium]